MAELWIGTSGWVYKHWIDVLYPPKLPAGRYLPLYAAELPTVEINRSYYRLPERSVFEGWREQSPPGFLFAVKASRYLTHMKKLKDPEQPRERLSGETANAFSDDELATWAARIDGFLARGLDTYVYFNNDPFGDALRDAARLRTQLDGVGQGRMTA